jgi:hypothetical protein
MATKSGSEFVDDLLRSRTAAGSAPRSASGASRGSSVDNAEVLREGIEMASEGLAMMHAALDADSEETGEEPLPDTLPGSLDDEFEALSDALAEFANAAADALDEVIEIDIPDLDDE